MYKVDEYFRFFSGCILELISVVCRACCKQIGAEKPNPCIFEAALQQLGIQAHEAVHVGDDRWVRGCGRVGECSQAHLGGGLQAGTHVSNH